MITAWKRHEERQEGIGAEPPNALSVLAVPSVLQLRRAMTLVEVRAVVVIPGLIAATLAVGFSGAFGKGKHELAKTQIGIIAGKLEAYRIEHDAWPEIGLDSLTDGHATPTKSYYLTQDQLLDPWGRRYELILPGPDGHPYEIVTFGADGAPGGKDDNADITSVSLRGADR